MRFQSRRKKSSAIVPPPLVSDRDPTTRLWPPRNARGAECTCSSLPTTNRYRIDTKTSFYPYQYTNAMVHSLGQAAATCITVRARVETWFVWLKICSRPLTSTLSCSKEWNPFLYTTGVLRYLTHIIQSTENTPRSCETIFQPQAQELSIKSSYSAACLRLSRPFPEALPCQLPQSPTWLQSSTVLAQASQPSVPHSRCLGY